MIGTEYQPKPLTEIDSYMSGWRILKFFGATGNKIFDAICSAKVRKASLQLICDGSSQ